MDLFGFYVRRWPRTAAAVAFGSATAVVTHFAWLPGARMNGVAPVLTIAAGAAHAVAGAITGPRLLDGTRTRTSADACLLGAGTSLLAVVVLSPPFALWVSATGGPWAGVLSYLLLTVLIGLFSFLGAGWALLLVSIAVAWGLHRVASRSTGA